MTTPGDAGADEAVLSARLEQAMRGAADDARLVRRGHTLSADCAVIIGSTRHLLRIEQGRVVECTRSFPLLSSTHFTVKGSLAAWSALWQPVPAPGWHDVFALTKRGEMSIEGQTRPVMAHLQFIKDLLALPRARAPHGG